ncbi:MAG: hypothetical protein WC856_19385 [Methylococcaceae bacterium]|jgi:hypothetical protein
MKKTKILLIFLVSTLGYSTSYAQDEPQQSTHHYIRDASITSFPTPNKHDNFGTTITVYSLIIGVYALYWFRRKA